ncbi:MAG: hypothetical protein Q7O66_20710, partial [Dehalococcoidia bacterium]|nr:hypothetical protein [Dehalococcoidia bacterium]
DPRTSGRSDMGQNGKFVPGSIMDSSRRRAAPMVTSGGYRPGSIILRQRQRAEGVERSLGGQQSTDQNPEDAQASA